MHQTILIAIPLKIYYYLLLLLLFIILSLNVMKSVALLRADLLYDTIVYKLLHFKGTHTFSKKYR